MTSAQNHWVPILCGIGLAVPEHAFKQALASEESLSISTHSAVNPNALKALYHKTRIQERGSVLYKREANEEPAQVFFQPQKNASDYGPGTQARMEIFEQEAPKLALAAARAALQDAGTSAQEITHLVIVSCTGFSSPGIDFELIRGLGLSPTVARVQVGFMGCHGMINGLRTARAFACENSRHRILLCSVEIASIHYSYELDGGSAIANALFADGASACVLAAQEPKAPAWQVAATGSFFIPDSADLMGWRIGDHGFKMSLLPEVPDLIGHHLKESLENWLASYDLNIGAIRSWAVHPGGPRILDQTEKSLGLSSGSLDVSRKVLNAYGNMSSATILFILDRLRLSDAPRPCVALAFGPGLVAEAALFL